MSCPAEKKKMNDEMTLAIDRAIRSKEMKRRSVDTLAWNKSPEFKAAWYELINDANMVSNVEFILENVCQYMVDNEEGQYSKKHVERVRRIMGDPDEWLDLLVEVIQRLLRNGDFGELPHLENFSDTAGGRDEVIGDAVYDLIKNHRK